MIDTLRGAAGDVDDAEALFEAGWELVEVDLDALAVTPLARALTLQPQNVAIVNELALALEAAGSPAEAARLYRENAWAAEAGMLPRFRGTDAPHPHRGAYTVRTIRLCATAPSGRILGKASLR